MVTYFDLRSSCNAMRELHGKLLKHIKLDIHFYSLKVCYKFIMNLCFLCIFKLFIWQKMSQICCQVNNIDNADFFCSLCRIILVALLSIKVWLLSITQNLQFQMMSFAKFFPFMEKSRRSVTQCFCIFSHFNLEEQLKGLSFSLPCFTLTFWTDCRFVKRPSQVLTSI